MLAEVFRKARTGLHG